MTEYGFLINTTIAGILASLACGLGALPLLIKQFNIEKNVGLGYAFASGLMFAASVYNLILPGLTIDGMFTEFDAILKMIGGILCGAWFLWRLNNYLSTHNLDGMLSRAFQSKQQLLIFVAMGLHSIPEGVAVGVGYASGEHVASAAHLGNYIALAIAIHNIPEGLAVSIPLRAKGATIFKCAFMAFLTSLPQPLAAVPASLLVWLFEPLMIPFLGFAAGAMIYLVMLELIPDALETQSRSRVAWSFIIGFCLMILVQVIL